MHVRTRFAPSPTGDLHLGSVRTALYAWLFARHHGGDFILRIEDTDLERSTEESVHTILEGLQWMGLEADEGPFYQMKRMDRYREALNDLLNRGWAYRCYCGKEHLETLRNEQMAQGLKPRYDGCCRDKQLPHRNEPYVIRFRNPEDGEITFHDAVYGSITIANKELDDLVLARGDGTPTYNFSVVVDDWEMKITHVVRGADHLNNTPRQINLFQAFNAPVPHFAHLPMILGSDGKKLSKRHGALSVLAYREAGYLPEALMNYLVRLGWSHGDQEIFTKDEMIAFFDVVDIHKAPAAFNPEKLLWLNQHYIKTLPSEKVAQSLIRLMNDVDISKGPALSEVIRIQAERSKTLVEMVDKSRYFFTNQWEWDPALVSKYLSPSLKKPLQEIQEKLLGLTHWSAENIHNIVVETAETHALKLGQLAQPIRVALTGGTVSPPIDETIYVLGREEVHHRFSNALSLFKNEETSSG